MGFGLLEYRDRHEWTESIRVRPVCPHHQTVIFFSLLRALLNVSCSSQRERRGKSRYYPCSHVWEIHSRPQLACFQTDNGEDFRGFFFSERREISAPAKRSSRLESLGKSTLQFLHVRQIRPISSIFFSAALFWIMLSAIAAAPPVE